MHIELIAVVAGVIRQLISQLRTGRPVIAVGTTSARTLESLYWLGARVSADVSVAPQDLAVHQWDAYTRLDAYAPSSGEIGVEAALTALLDWMDRQGIGELVTTTQLLIVPGYRWKIVKGLVTNFHQPESTLLLLIASLVGEDWRTMYRYALDRGFRFLSYGDGCLLLP